MYGTGHQTTDIYIYKSMYVSTHFARPIRSTPPLMLPPLLLRPPGSSVPLFVPTGPLTPTERPGPISVECSWPAKDLVTVCLASGTGACVPRCDVAVAGAAAAAAGVGVWVEIRWDLGRCCPARPIVAVVALLVVIGHGDRTRLAQTCAALLASGWWGSTSR